MNWTKNTILHESNNISLSCLLKCLHCICRPSKVSMVHLCCYFFYKARKWKLSYQKVSWFLIFENFISPFVTWSKPFASWSWLFSMIHFVVPVPWCHSRSSLVPNQSTTHLIDAYVKRTLKLVLRRLQWRRSCLLTRTLTRTTWFSTAPTLCQYLRIKIIQSLT